MRRPCGTGRRAGGSGGTKSVAALLGSGTPIDLGEGQAKLQIASFNRCWRTMPRGMVKRVPWSGPLITYKIACPGCSLVRPYNSIAIDAGGVSFTERGELLEGFSLKCEACGRTVTLARGVMTAVA